MTHYADVYYVMLYSWDYAKCFKKTNKQKKNVKRVDTIPAFMEFNVVSFSSLILIFALLIAS